MLLICRSRYWRGNLFNHLLLRVVVADHSNFPVCNHSVQGVSGKCFCLTNYDSSPCACVGFPICVSYGWTSLDSEPRNTFKTCNGVIFTTPCQCDCMLMCLLFTWLVLLVCNLYCSANYTIDQGEAIKGAVRRKCVSVWLRQYGRQRSHWEKASELVKRDCLRKIVWEPRLILCGYRTCESKGKINS